MKEQSSKYKYKTENHEKKQRNGNISYTQAGVSCFVGQESAKFKVQFFDSSLSVKNPPLRQAGQTLSVSVKRQTNQQYDNEIFAA